MTRQNFFVFITSHHDVSEKKILQKQKKIRVTFSFGDFPAKPAEQKKQVALKKSLRLHTRRGPAAAAERVYCFLKKNIFFKIPDLAHRPTSAWIVPKKGPIDGATDFLDFLVLTRKPKNSSKLL